MFASIHHVQAIHGPTLTLARMRAASSRVEVSLAPTSRSGVDRHPTSSRDTISINQAAAFAGGFAAAVAIGAGTGVIGTGVLLYGAYQGANHVCRQMVSKVDDDDGEDSECESSDSEKDESTSTDRKNEVTNETCECRLGETNVNAVISSSFAKCIKS